MYKYACWLTTWLLCCQLVLPIETQHSCYSFSICFHPLGCYRHKRQWFTDVGKYVQTNVPKPSNFIISHPFVAAQPFRE